MDKLPRIDIVFDWKRQAKVKGDGFVYVRVYYDRNNRQYISTGVKVSPNEWSEQFHVIRREDAAQLNRVIDDCVQKVKESIIAADGEKPATDVMRVDRSDDSFLKFIRNEIECSKLGVDTKKHHVTMLNSLEEFGKIRRFDHVTNANLYKYMSYIGCKNIGQTTIYDYYKRLRVYVRKAQKMGYVQYNVGITVTRGKSKDREHLTDAEIEMWRTADLTSNGKPIQHLVDARDRFSVQIGTGLSYADLMNVDFSRREELNGMVTVSGQRVKTNETFFLVVLPIAVEVLERWGWKVPPISNAKYNDYLDVVALRAGITKHITSHVGRHTYACWCLSHGISTESLKRTLGHSDIKTTQIYAKIMDMDVVNEFSKLK